MRLRNWLRALFRRTRVSQTTARWSELVNDRNVPQGAIVCYPRTTALAIIDDLRWREVQVGSGGSVGNVSSAFADTLAAMSPVVAAGLSGGELFQIVGSPAVIKGLQTGSLTMVKSGSALLGTVTSSSGGQFVAQVRFSQTSMAPVLAPVLAWQILHAVAGTAQLVRINQRLDGMQRSIERILARQEAGVLGEVRSSAAILDDVLAEYRQVGSFSNEMTVRLALVEQRVGSLLQRNKILVEGFRAKAATVKRKRGKAGAAAAAGLLSEEAVQALNDGELLAALMRLDLEVERARVYQALQMAPGDVPRRFDAIQAKVGRYREALSERLSIGEIQKHARACVDAMSWWQRNLTARGLVRDVSDAQKLEDHRDLVEAGADSVSEAAPEFLIWRDATGKNQVRLISGDSGPIPSMPDELQEAGQPQDGVSDPLVTAVKRAMSARNLGEGRCPDCGQALWWKAGSELFPHCGKSLPEIVSQ